MYSIASVPPTFGSPVTTAEEGAEIVKVCAGLGVGDSAGVGTFEEI